MTLQPGTVRIRTLVIVALLVMCSSGFSYIHWGANKKSATSSNSPQHVRQPAGGGAEIPLWPESVTLGQPDTAGHPEESGIGTPLVGGRKWHWISHVSRPTMTVYKPRGTNVGATMLVIPGGGFHAVAVDLEGTEICDWVVSQGITCVLLKYRVPQVWPTKDGVGQRPKTLYALEDAQRAIGMLRQRAAVYGINPNKIGVLGFSAGAYVAAEMSNSEKPVYSLSDAARLQSPMPDFAIVVYAARMLDNSKGKNSLKLQPWVKISAKAPPTLIIHAMNDPIGDVRNPLAYALALRDAGVPVDIRIYAEGGHAFGMRPTSAPVTKEWPGHARQWLQNLAILPKG